MSSLGHTCGAMMTGGATLAFRLSPNKGTFIHSSREANSEVAKVDFMDSGRRQGG